MLSTKHSFYIATGITVLAYVLNLYKFPLFIEHMVSVYPYEIFPWQDDGQESSSNPLWLFIHLLVALADVTLSAQWIKSTNYKIDQMHQNVHAVFSFLVMINIMHFGEASVPVAIMMNGIPLALTIYFRYFIEEGAKFYEQRKMLFFLALTSPVLFELGMWLTS